MTITAYLEAWPGTMTGRERFNRQMRREPVDRCFNAEFGYWEENFRQWPLFVEHGVTDNAQADRFFGFDRMGFVGGNSWMCPPFKPILIEETETTRIVRNSEGLIAEVPKDGHSTIPHFSRPSIVTPEDWKRCKAERLDVNHPARKVDIEAIRGAHPPGRDYPLGVDCGSMIGKIRNMLTFEGLAYAVHDYPEMVEDMVETACVLVENFLDQVLGVIDFDLANGWEDICFRNGPIVSVGFFESVVVPRYRRIGDRLRAHGIDLWRIDCDGDVRPLIPGFLAGGVNCMYPWEVNSSGHPGESMDAFGAELRIMGGVDKMVLAHGRSEIADYLESLVPYVRRGGFIPHCDHRCPPDVSQDNYLYYLDLKRELFCTPITGHNGEELIEDSAG